MNAHAGNISSSNPPRLAFAKGAVPCVVDRAMALAFLGHRGQQLDGDLEARLEAMAQRCESENVPRFAWRTLRPQQGVAGSEVAICFEQCGLELPGADIAAHLDGSSHVVLLAVTLGSAYLRTLEALNATSPTDALLFDACASAATEAAVNAAHELLAKAAHAEGLEARARFSPGYGDLPLTVQPAFLTALDAPRSLGVFATESNLLMPSKSITAIVGLFEPCAQDCAQDGNAPHQGDEKVLVDAQCRKCGALNYCNFRENGTTCHG